MMKQDEGSIEFGAVIILFFLSAILVSSALFVQASMIYFRKNSNEQEEKAMADKLLREITSSFQELTSYEYDNIDNPVLSYLRKKYADYDIDFTDISSGFHLDFLSDKELQDEKISKFLFLNDSPSEFISFRNNNGLTTDKTKWKGFLKEQAMKACVSYGWIHKSQIDSFAFKVTSTSHKTTELKSLFPLVNEIPMINVNMVSPDIITLLILRPSFKIEKSAEKAETLKNKLLQGSVIISDLSSYLEVPREHAIFAYLGTKTAFWKIVFCYRKGMYVEAVIAAIPKQNGGIQEIIQYKLIDRVIRYER